MSSTPDRLYDLLPLVHRRRDAEEGYPLRALLRAIGEQVAVVERDIARLYENWFIETCEDWAVPYIAELIGYRPVAEAGEPGTGGRERDKVLVPRREVANTLRHRGRKGTLALLELLAGDVAGWPARAVEFRDLLLVTQSVKRPRPERGRTVDLRRGDALDRLDGPFDELAHTVEVRCAGSHRAPGRHGIPAVGLFVWPLRVHSVTRAPAYCLQEAQSNCFTFSVLGNDTPLYAKPEPEAEPTAIAGEGNLPVAIRRRALAARLAELYGEGRSLAIWVGERGRSRAAKVERRLVPIEELVVADLTGWHYRPRRGQVAIDPQLGRIAFPPRQPPQQVWVSYHDAFSADLGGGEYRRPLPSSAGARLYRVGEGQEWARLGDALAVWGREQPPRAIVEIADSGAYAEPIHVELAAGQSLTLRAANGRRPVIRLLDWLADQPDALSVQGESGSSFTLDGLLVTGRGLKVQGDLAAVTIRHSTLVPGWGITRDCKPRWPAEPSLELFDVGASGARVVIDHSIVGSIQVNADEVGTDPLAIHVRDSILDATSEEREALGAPGCPAAHARLTIERSTVFGAVQAHAIELAENSLFEGMIRVARRQIGCMRFCSYCKGSRTPRRYACQPDLAEATALAAATDPAEGAAAAARERDRVRPRFVSTRYGTPGYCRLAAGCAEEIRRGADDESEMGVFHDLYRPQRTANLRARLAEFTPAGADAGLIDAG